jgi:hypothetical protein
MGVVFDQRKDFFGAGSQLSFRRLVPFFHVSFYSTRKFLAYSTIDNGSSSLALARSCSF